MLLHNLTLELRNLVRNHWLSSMTLLLVVLSLYAAWNGKNHVTQRKDSIAIAIDDMEASDRLLAAQLDSIKDGFEINLQPWWYPDSPTAAADKHPRIAAFEPGPLTFLATGQSDLYSHYVKPTMTGDSYALAFTELTSPVSLLMGQFDPAFVLVYLLPLVIISLCYNILSAEKELGSLVLIASSPLNLRLWLLQKTYIRFILMAILLAVCLVIMLVLNGVLFSAGLWQLFLAVWLYAAFWFALSYLVNLAGKSSARNAITLLGLWVTLVLAVPSLVGQWANAIYPVPSRALLINEMRTLKAEVTKAQDDILDGYLRNHPELIALEADKESPARRTQWYFAAKELVEQQMEPLLATYNGSLDKQQTWVNQFAFLSPSILFQNSLNHMAGTSSAHYKAYREEVILFAEEWRNFFLPLAFADKKFTKDLIAQFPGFQWDKSQIKSPLFVNDLALAVMVILLILVGLKTRSAKEIEGIMKQ